MDHCYYNDEFSGISRLVSAEATGNGYWRCTAKKDGLTFIAHSDELTGFPDYD